MTYKEIMKTVDTDKALTLLGIEFEQQGSYDKFQCSNCNGKVNIKRYDEAKNLYHCPTCKSGGHIISLTMSVKGLEWKEATEFLEKAVVAQVKKITEELKLTYELNYCDQLKSRGISEDTCKTLVIGIPKGRTMLAGSIAFLVKDETGMKIAYYGIKLKDGKPVFHSSFNPETVIYNFCEIDKMQTVYFTTDMFLCVQNIELGKQSVCNFGLPYISQEQYKLLNQLDKIVFLIAEENRKEIAYSNSLYLKRFYTFE